MFDISNDLNCLIEDRVPSFLAFMILSGEESNVYRIQPESETKISRRLRNTCNIENDGDGLGDNILRTATSRF